MKIKMILSENNRKPYNEALPSNTTLKKAAERMCEKGVGAMLVVDPDDSQRHVGIISERDILRRCCTDDDFKQTKIESVMSRDLLVAKDDDDVDYVMKIMNQRNIRHIPIVNNESKIIDLISIRDILRSTIEADKITIQHLSDFSRGTRRNDVY
ncbi:MAG: hypothetical protein A2020_06345 [Lentisphaerae bacterium GWF2_45_14]|nr:MAG: hypothetical protein A2020_06345 [Lentisphaerae bacterium GWF2_45_14]